MDHWSLLTIGKCLVTEINTWEPAIRSVKMAAHMDHVPRAAGGNDGLILGKVTAINIYLH